jgi:hypothetical protein
MFSIYRSQTALIPLNETWEHADATLREAIVQASRQVDQQLQSDPYEQGESREEGTRILFQAPLAVTFEVDEPKKLVRILRAWTFTRATQRQGDQD